MRNCKRRDNFAFFKKRLPRSTFNILVILAFLLKAVIVTYPGQFLLSFFVSFLSRDKSCIFVLIKLSYLNQLRAISLNSSLDCFEKYTSFIFLAYFHFFVSPVWLFSLSNLLKTHFLKYGDVSTNLLVIIVYDQHPLQTPIGSW